MTADDRGAIRSAHVYAQRFGWSVIPLHDVSAGHCSCSKGEACPSGGKHPRLNDWAKLATNDLEEIAEWQAQFPNANIGIATGSASGFFVLDVDPDHGGDETLAELEEEHGELPETVKQETGSGGFHYLYALPPGMTLTNTAGKLGKGLDTRGDRGQIVVAPSVSAKGSYRWVNSPFTHKVAQAPARLLAELATTIERVTTSQVEVLPPTVVTPDLADAIQADVERLGYAVQGQGGDAVTFRLGALLLNDWLLTIEQAKQFALPWNLQCQPQWPIDELLQKLDNGGRYSKGERGAAIRRHRRPSIQLIAGRLADTATAAEAALIESKAEIYQRGGALVRPVIDEADAAHGHRTATARLHTIDATYMQDLMSRQIRFERTNSKKETVTADPPMSVAMTLMARAGEWRFNTVAGVITTPTLRPDSSIFAASGYDATTQLLMVSPPSMPEIADRPTRSDALEALGRIDALFSEFPFVDDASRSVALSAVLTVVARGSMLVAPGHAASATTPGTGKSYLFDIASTIATGQRCPVIAAGRTDEELEKRLGAALLGGQPIISIDNVTSGLGGDALCMLIERPSPQIRVLGRSELIKVDARATVFATGNNLSIVGDVTRRFLLARLDANLERPELRQFKANPCETVMADRGRYVADALIICRAYHSAGRPSLAPRLASFEQWSDTVRSALMWLGRADPCLTMESGRDSDPLLELHRNFLTGFVDRFGRGREHAKTAAELLQQVELESNVLAEATLAAAANHGRSDVRTLGKWLARHRGRIVGGLALRSETGHARSMRWWIEPVGVGELGGLGEFNFSPKGEQ